MKRLLILLMALSLSGCSGFSPLSGLIGNKPDLTVQAGKENVKQTVGVTAKQDTSSKQETTVKDSAINKLDTSSKKQVATTTISAESITADKIEIQSKDDNSGFAVIAAFISGLCFGYLFGGSKKEA